MTFAISYPGFQQASQAKLAFVNDAGNAIMKVDNSTTIMFGDKRNSIRIASKDQYTVGSLWVADMLHLPYGVTKHSLPRMFLSLIPCLVFRMACMVVICYNLASRRGNW